MPNAIKYKFLNIVLWRYDLPAVYFQKTGTLMAFVPMDSDKLNSLLPFANEECSSETLSPDVSKEFDETFQFKNEVTDQKLR